MRFDKYLSVFKNSWQATFEYRVSTLVRFFIGAIMIISVFYLWSDVFSDRVSLMGYEKEEIVTYYIIVGYLFSSIFASVPIAAEIRTGQLSNYITKPISYFLYQYSQTFAKRMLRLILGLPVVIGLFVVFRESVFIVTTPSSYLFLLVTALFAINILFFIDIIIGMIEFWVMFSDSITMITDLMIFFLSGVIIPIVFLPGYIQVIANYLPFKYTGTFLIDSFLGRVETQEIFIGIGVQFLWIFVLYFIAKLIWGRGLKKYEAVGG